jgi:hypothetical protein
MHRFLCRALVLIAACYGSPGSAFTPPPDQSLTGLADGLPSARFHGQSLSANGQFLAVGAPGNAAAGVAGAVWIYAHSGGAYSLFDLLQAPSPVAGDGFGQHVQFVGDQLLVGAPQRSVNGVSGRGEVFVFVPVAGEFSLAQTVQPGVALGQNDLFGFHLSADGGWLAVGVPLAGNNDPGQVQLYRYDGDFETWLYHSTLSGTAGGGRLGLRVLMRGDRLLAAAPQEDIGNGDTTGYVYEFLRSGSGAGASFAQVQRFRPSSFPVGDAPQAFGSALALSPDGTELIIGAPFDEETDGDRRGAIYMFSRNAGSWAQRQRLASPAADRGENFGSPVVFDDDGRALVGDIRESDAGNALGGAVHEITRPLGPAGQNWIPGRAWRPAAGTQLDFFGNAIALSDAALIIAAPGDDVPSGPFDVGSAYVYFGIFADGFE